MNLNNITKLDRFGPFFQEICMAQHHFTFILFGPEGVLRLPFYESVNESFQTRPILSVYRTLSNCLVFHVRHTFGKLHDFQWL